MNNGSLSGTIFSKATTKGSLLTKVFRQNTDKKAKSVQETCYHNNFISSNNTLISNITIFLGEFPETQNIDVFD